MKAAPFTANEYRGLKDSVAFKFPKNGGRVWFSKIIESLEIISKYILSSSPRGGLRLYLQSLLDFTRSQETALFSVVLDKVDRNTGMNSSNLYGKSQSQESKLIGVVQFQEDSSVKGFEAKGLSMIDGIQPLKTDGVGNKDSFRGVLLPKAIEKVQMHPKPNQRLNHLHHEGVLSEEVASLLEAGLWEYTVDSKAFFCTDYVYTLLNVSLTKPFEGFESFLPYIKDEARVSLKQSWNALMSEGSEFDHLVELLREDKVTWVRFKGKSIIKGGKVSKLVGTIQNVTEVVEKENQLIVERKKAEHTAIVKTDFVSHMSHEVRTPLNAILGLTYLLLQDEDLNEKYRENLNSIHFSSQSLLSLINSTLDYSKMEAGKVELEKVNFDLLDLLKNTHQALHLRALEKKIDFELSIDPRTPAEIAGDPVRLMQVLNNLMSNAIKFTEKGSVKLGVEVIYQTEQDWVLEFSVTDTGIGIPLDKQKHVFESFVQVNSSTHRQYGGTGLGLAIAKKIVELHKGKIQVKSVPGEGSVFSIRLRFIKPQPSLITIPKISSSKITSTKLKDIKVLVVDDNEMNKTVAKKLLTSWAVDVDTAGDGLSALEMINTNDYDLILMDLYMPVLDGYHAVLKIRETGNQIPVIALTANASEEEKRKIFQAGANDYLTKPFIPQDLFDKILHNLVEYRKYQEVAA